MNESMPQTHWRTLWLSDVRLGSSDCQAEVLLDFLTRHKADTLYLVGNLIDGWQLSRSWHWPSLHNDVVQRLLRKAHDGTRIVYLAGNRDDFARRFLGLAFGDIDIADDAVHTLADGRRLLIMHGSHLDGVLRYGRKLSCVGEALYPFAMSLHYRLSRLRVRLSGGEAVARGRDRGIPTPPSPRLVMAFESAIVAEAKRRGLDGAVCGHLPQPDLGERDGVTYATVGDWTRHSVALAEDHEGRLSLIEGDRRGQSAMLRSKHSIKLPALPSTLQRGNIRDHS